MHDRNREVGRDLRRLEGRHGGRLGVAILDTAGTASIACRGDERFAMCSTFKFLAAAFVLARVDRNSENLGRRVRFTGDYFVSHSPITERHAGRDGMTMGQICEAAVTVSDNTAGNLLLDSFGGPAELTAYFRSLGDGVTRLDRREPELNEVGPGDQRDTTTPIAMLELLRKIVVGDALRQSSREQMIEWLIASKTGERRLRAGVPKDCTVGDKTGSGAYKATNDIGVIWRPSGTPILVAAFYAEANASLGERDAILAQVGRLAVSSAE